METDARFIVDPQGGTTDTQALTLHAVKICEVPRCGQLTTHLDSRGSAHSSHEAMADAEAGYRDSYTR